MFRFVGFEGFHLSFASIQRSVRHSTGGVADAAWNGYTGGKCPKAAYAAMNRSRGRVVWYWVGFWIGQVECVCVCACVSVLLGCQFFARN